VKRPEARHGITRAAVALMMAAVLASATAAFARRGADKKEKAKPASAQTVDSGSFGVFVKGQRVLTETFSIEQHNGSSSIKSQLKQAAGADSASQKSDLEISSSGELLSYEWSESSGGSLTVVPNNEFLIEKIMTGPGAKPAERPFLMPSTSMIVDNNFFVQREVLAWKYLAADCKSEGDGLKCQQGPVEFGTIVPQDRTSMPMRMELIGKEKIAIHGAEHELLRLNLKGENFDWALWVEGPQDGFKLMRVSIPADDTEVVRD